jgi:hypothetical protein
VARVGFDTARELVAEAVGDSAHAWYRPQVLDIGARDGCTVIDSGTLNTWQSS